MSYTQSTAMSGFVFLPQDILDWMNRLNGSVVQLDTDVTASQASDQFRNAWNAYKARWDAFYQAHQGWFSRISGTTADEVAAYEAEYNLWLNGFAKEPGAHPMAKPSSEEHGGLQLSDSVRGVTQLILVAGGVYLAVVLIPPLLKKSRA